MLDSKLTHAEAIERLRALMHPAPPKETWMERAVEWAMALIGRMGSARQFDRR